jgi:hypothetical protein
MRIVGLLCNAIVLLLALAALSSSQIERTDTTASVDPVLVRKIRAGDYQAIIEAGSSGNHNYISDLKELEKSWKMTNRGASMALAKLGEADEQRRVWCNSLGEYNPLPTFEYIGGWYGIQASTHFLLPEAQRKWRKMRAEERPSDITPPPSTAFWALVALSRLIPNPPNNMKITEGSGLGFNMEDADPHLEALKPYIMHWQEWISQHRGDLSKLEPTGDGVDFSPRACKKSQTRKSHP